ncbi:hypothetical protein [Corynebacterium lowii]|uniref:Uncharacterized protein n=1 Tax=Corynebacterium lowii TaxID=1544413 RepID=A0A0Q0YYF6_9CORY|nr:hypothetical protein [Corynebacterium lowii]KQB87414.1 hypothetical protein Clow_00473 [Corynebacterium lowii]
MLLLSLVAWYAGRVVAVLGWQGEYSLRLNLIGDLGVHHCAPMEDFFIPRVACSPHYQWFIAGSAVSAALLVGAGALVMRQGRTLSAARPMGLGLIAVGTLRGGGLVISVADNPAWHYGLMLAALVALWAVMVTAARATRMQRAMVAQGASISAPMGGPLVPLTWLLWGISLLGTALLIAAALGSGSSNPVGLYQRLAVDAPSLWMLALASGWWRR